MKANYTVTKSMAATLSIWRILFFWLIIPLIIQIYKMVEAKNDVTIFADGKVIRKSGVLNKHEQQSVFNGVYSVSVEQSFFGRIFNYGNVSVDCPGKWDVDTTGIKDPQGLKHFLETQIAGNNIKNIVLN